MRIASFRLCVLASALAIAVATASGASARSANQWPKVDQRGYLAGCIRSSGNAPLCRCQLAWLERRYTAAQFNSLFVHHRRTFILVVTKASLRCIK